MAAKRLLPIILLLAIVTAIALLQLQRSRRAARLSVEDERFIATYTELAVAREIFSGNSDSLASVYQRIFLQNGTDSTWMLDHIRSMSDDTERKLLLWDRIVDRLDSLKKDSYPKPPLNSNHPRQ
jgi:hypothetical protein